MLIFVFFFLLQKYNKSKRNEYFRNVISTETASAFIAIESNKCIKKKKSGIGQLKKMPKKRAFLLTLF